MWQCITNYRNRTCCGSVLTTRQMSSSRSSFASHSMAYFRFLWPTVLKRMSAIALTRYGEKNCREPSAIHGFKRFSLSLPLLLFLKVPTCLNYPGRNCGWTVWKTNIFNLQERNVLLILVKIKWQILIIKHSSTTASHLEVTEILSTKDFRSAQSRNHSILC